MAPSTPTRLAKGATKCAALDYHQRLRHSLMRGVSILHNNITLLPPHADEHREPPQGGGRLPAGPPQPQAAAAAPARSRTGRERALPLQRRSVRETARSSDTSTSLYLARWSEIKQSLAAGHIALRSRCPAARRTSVSSPPPPRRGRRKPRRRRSSKAARFSLSFATFEAARPLSVVSFSRVQYNLAAFSKRSPRRPPSHSTGRGTRRHRARATSHGDGELEVGDLALLCKVSLAPFCFPRSLRTPGTWDTNTKEGGCRCFS